jgi:hypothetical protein
MFILEQKGQEGETCVVLFYCEYSKDRTICGGTNGYRTLQRDLGNWESQGVGSRGGHQHLQIGRMLDIDLISEPPQRPLPPDVCTQSVGICVARGAGSDS